MKHRMILFRPLNSVHGSEQEKEKEREKRKREKRERERKEKEREKRKRKVKGTEVEPYHLFTYRAYDSIFSYSLSLFPFLSFGIKNYPRMHPQLLLWVKS